jgi:exopolysaccharide production protein ExoZ
MKQTFGGLQILRFAAAMLVAVMHITQAISIHITDRGDSVYWAAGTVGVDIFFVISGFVMAISTMHMPMQGPSRLSNAWIFMKRRIHRIVPVYWFYTLLKAALLLAVPALAAKSTIDGAHLAASLAFVPAVAPWGLVQPTLPVGWTLNLEMLFYLVFALAIALGSPRIRFCLTVFLALFLASQFLPSSTALSFYAQSIIFEFVVGVALAHALVRCGPATAAAGAVLLVAGAAFTFGVPWAPEAGRLLSFGLGASVIVLGTLWLEPSIERTPLTRPLAFLGDASYSIYLSHTFIVPACAIALRKLGIVDTATAFVLMSAAVIVTGALSYLWIEQPLLAIFKRLLFRPTPAAYPHAANTASH